MGDAAYGKKRMSGKGRGGKRERRGRQEAGWGGRRAGEGRKGRVGGRGSKPTLHRPAFPLFHPLSYLPAAITA